MSGLKWINIVAPEAKGGAHRSSLGYKDGGDRLATCGVIPHGADWVPASRVDRDRLVNWLRALDYKAGSDLVAGIPKRGDSYEG